MVVVVSGGGIAFEVAGDQSRLQSMGRLPKQSPMHCTVIASSGHIVDVYESGQCQTPC